MTKEVVVAPRGLHVAKAWRLWLLLLGVLAGGILFGVRRLERRAQGSPGAAAPSPEIGSKPAASDLPPSPTGFGETLTLGQKYDALISRFGGDLTSTKADLDMARKELETLRAAVQAERTAGEKERTDLGDTLRKLREGLAREVASARGVPASPTPILSRAAGELQSGSIRSIELSSAPALEAKSRRSVRIPTASGGAATILNGVFAPVSGEPSPVRLRLDSAILGPDRARIPLRNAYLIGKATGDPNGCRVSIQIEKFSTVKAGGEAIETKALGYVVGEDGLEGVPGSYEWRAGQFVPLATAVGGLQGMSGALAQTQTSQTLTPLGGATSVLTGDSAKFAGYQALGGAAGKLGEIVAERMKEIRPAVSTPANRRVTVVFLDGITLDGLDPREIDHAKEDDPFRGLDAHR